MLAEHLTNLHLGNNHAKQQNQNPESQANPKTNRRRNSLAHSHSTKLNLQELIDAGGHGSTYRNYKTNSKDSTQPKQQAVHYSRSHIQPEPDEGPTKSKNSKLKKKILFARESKATDNKDSSAGSEESESSLTVASKISSQENIHSRNFRSYCNHFITPELLQFAEKLVGDVFRFQDRAYHRNQIKAVASKRYVVGFHECRRKVQNGKLKMLLIAPDLEIANDNGIGEIIDGFKTSCNLAEIPCIFAMRRRKLGFLLAKKVPVSCIGIISYDGSEDAAKFLIALVQQQRLAYEEAQSKKEG